MSLLGQFDQFFEGITIVFKSLFNALWHLIRHVGARYAGKLRHVLIHQFPTRPLTDIVAKDLEMFKDALPQALRIGILWNPTTPSHPPALKAVEAAGAMLEVSLHMVPMSTGFRRGVRYDDSRTPRRFSRRGVAGRPFTARSPGRACARASAARGIRK